MGMVTLRCPSGHANRVWFTDTPGMAKPKLECSECGAEALRRRAHEPSQRTTSPRTVKQAGAGQSSSRSESRPDDGTAVLAISLLALAASQPPSPAPSFESGCGGNFGGAGASDSF